MKKLLLSLLALMTISAHAMVEQTAVFDFSDLNKLNATPVLTEAEKNKVINTEVGAGLNVTSRSFTEGMVTLSFEQSISSGASLYHSGNDFFLNLGPYTVVKFAVSGGCQLSSISFSQSISAYEVSAGRMNSSRNGWSAPDGGVSDVKISLGNNSVLLNKITIKYLRPSTPLNFLSSSPANGGSFTGTFKTMTLSFSTTVTKINSTSSITLTGSDVDGGSINQQLTASASGSTVTLTASQAIDKDATLKVQVPAGMFENSEGASNELIDLAFTVRAKRNTFNPINIFPEPGTVPELPQEIRLTFDNFAKEGTGVVKFKQTDGEGNFPSTSLEIDAENKKVGIIRHENGSQTDASTWTVEIPEGLFHNQYYGVDETEDRWNEARTLTYVVDGSQAGPQLSAVFKAAKAMLQQIGVGYPKTSSATYQALKALVEAETIPEDDALTTAMTALYNETDVEMPVVDKWYNIAGLNSKGNQLFLMLNKEHTAAGLNLTGGTTAAFKTVTSAEGKVVFQTKEGLFLHVPTILPMHTGTSDINLTTELSDVNTLTFAKFAASTVEGTDTESLYGAFTINGSLGTNTVTGIDETAYAMFDHSTSKITTYPGAALAFGEKNSNAFILVETTEPVDYKDIIYPRVGFRPAIIEKAGDKIILVVTGPASTTIADATKIYFTKSTAGEDNNERVDFTETILTATDVANEFSVNTAGLPAGDYNLVMDNGAFEFTAPEGKSIMNFDLTSTLYIQGGSTPIPPTPGEIEPTATLSTQNIYYAGEELILTIGNVSKAILKTPMAPYYIYAEGEKAGETVTYDTQIVKSRANTVASFDIATSGLPNGKYTLILPVGTFTCEALDATKTVTDKQLSVTFTIQNSDLPTTDFDEVLSGVSYLNPNVMKTTEVVYKDIVLNDLVVFAYKYNVSGLVPGTGKVKVVSVFGVPIMEGKLVAYPNIAAELGQYSTTDFTEVYALKFVPDTPLQAGDLNNFPGTFTFTFEAAAFGDANYGKWRENPASIAASACKVNPEMAGPSFQINNETGYDPTAIRNLLNKDAKNGIIFDLYGRRVETSMQKGVYIMNGKKIVVK